ncbi:MAG TPA: hypothetical protein VMK12_03960 [Anaeromyxobacteraceae bacterium]|nr:hypothetical protein [Anaeromyxobacteraceae bacterium]
MSAMPMTSGMPAGMPMMMPMPVPLSGMGMPMMGGFMPGVPGMGGMPMPMMGGFMPNMMGSVPMMAVPMMCHMSCEMTKEGMVCTMRPMDGSGAGMMTERCNAMNAMMAMGMPCLMSFGATPMMIGMAGGK